MNQHHQMREALRKLKSEERVRTFAEAQYWLNQYKLFAEQLLAAEPEKVLPERIRSIQIPTATMEQEFQAHYRRGFEAGKAAEPAPLVRLMDEDIERIFDSLPQFRSWAFTGPQKDFANAIMDAMERVNSRQLDQTPNSPSE